MKNMNAALLMLMTDPEVPYSSATSGVAARIDVLDTGDKKAQKAKTQSMVLFRLLDSLS